MKFRDKRKRGFLRLVNMKYLLLLSFAFLSSCTVSFRGVSIPAGVETFWIGNFIDNSDEYTVVTLAQDCTDGLLNKIQREANLVLNDENPDIEFSGTITLRITSEAVQDDQTASLERFTITVNAEYINNLDEEDNWKSSFSNYENFDPNESLESIQDDLISTILENIMEDIYQKAFTNW